MKCIDSISVTHKTIIIRCDLNVTIKDNKVLDDRKIKSSIKTIKYVLDNGGRAVILSHLGKIKTFEDKKKNSLKIVYNILNKYLDNKIKFTSDLDFNIIRREVAATPFGGGILLENTRFYDLDGEKESNCSLALAKSYASLGHLFVNDAFATIHRKHASNFGISKYLPSCIGFLMKDEINGLKLLESGTTPFAVVMGGSKVSDKIALINSLIKKVDKIFIGGAMAFTFLKALNINVGNSLVEEDYLPECKKLLTKYQDKIILPVDVIASTSFKDVKGKTFYILDIPNNYIAIDIGPKTIDLIRNEFADVKMVFCNGTMGVYEFSNYQKGTIEVLKILSKIEVSVIGGGDAISAIHLLGDKYKFSFISTGGGATLNYLISKKQPGLINIK